jgi:hypothetical protein
LKSWDRFRAQHLALAEREILTDAGVATVLANDSESPLAWLARRKGRDGRAMISPSSRPAKDCARILRVGISRRG